MLRNVTLIRAVSSCWISGKDSAEAVLPPNDVLCLPALGHARGAESGKEEKNVSLIPVNSLEKKNFRSFLFLLGCTFQPGVSFFSMKGLNYFLIIEEVVYSYCCRAAVQKVVI